MSTTPAWDGTGFCVVSPDHAEPGAATCNPGMGVFWVLSRDPITARRREGVRNACFAPVPLYLRALGCSSGSAYAGRIPALGGTRHLRVVVFLEGLNQSQGGIYRTGWLEDGL